jgi:hypothetical protein
MDKKEAEKGRIKIPKLNKMVMQQKQQKVIDSWRTQSEVLDVKNIRTISNDMLKYKKRAVTSFSRLLTDYNGGILNKGIGQPYGCIYSY